MAKTVECYFIENDYRGYSKGQALLFQDLARVYDNGTFDTCDLDYFYADLRIKVPTLTGAKFVNTYMPYNYLIGNEAYSYLMNIFSTASETYRQHWVENHLSRETIEAIPEFGTIAALMKKKAEPTPELKEKLKRRMVLYEDFSKRPEVAKYFSDVWKGEVEKNIAVLEEYISNNQWSDLQDSFDKFDKMGGMAVNYKVLGQAAMKSVVLWEGVSLVYNRVVRSLLAIGSGIFAVVVGSPAAVPAVMALFDFSDSSGEELTKASWHPDYTFGDAGTKIAYHAPFSLAKGLSFQAGPWIGAAVYGGVTALEAGGEPSSYPISVKERVKWGAVNGGIAFSSSASGLVATRIFYPPLMRFFGRTPSPAIFPKKVTIVPESPLPGTRVVISVEPASPTPAASVPARISTTPPPAPKSPPLRVAASPTGYLLQRTREAELALQRLQPEMKQPLDNLLMRIKEALERGTKLSQMRGVRALPQQEGVWEASVFSPTKGKVLFKITGSQGEQTIEIIDYK